MKKVIYEQYSEQYLYKNDVIRKTYTLLSLTFIISSICAFISMTTNARPLGFYTIIVYFILLYITNKFKENYLGIIGVFCLTGFLGYTLGPILNKILYGYANGGQIIVMSFSMTGIIFFSLSLYALITKKNFSYIAGFLFTGLLIVLISTLFAFLFNIKILQLAVSSMIVIISSGYILYETSELINGGEKNYIMATIGIYVQIFNIFSSLLHILSSLNGKRD